MFEELFLGPMLVSFFLGVSTIILLYWFSTKNHDYWENQGIPFAKPVPLLGSLYDIFRNSFHEVEVKRYKKYGPIYGHFEATRPVLSLADTSLLRDILVKDFQFFTGRRSFAVGDPVSDNMVSNLQGEDWKRVRSIITPTFTTGKIRRMLQIFKDCSKTLIQNFHASVKEGKTVDAKRIYGAFTMDIIASSAFSTKLDSHNDPENKFVQVARSVFTRNVNWRFMMFFLFPKIMTTFKIGVFSPSSMQFFKEATNQIIEKRKRTGQTRNDFLQLLLDTAKEVSAEEKWDEDKEGDIAANYGVEDASKLLKLTTRKNLNMDELLAQCVIFFIAGYDTTASTLSFASYLLALNQDKQALLREEVDRVIKEHKGEITYEAIQDMKYLDNVISETLRIYPPAVRAERLADSDYKLGDTGITVPKNMIITIPIYAMHHDPKFYPNPEKFEPDRFTPEERAKRDQYAYLPFGAGPRNCVGMRFALMEIKVCLAHVIADFSINICPQTKVPLDFFKGQGLLQPKGIILGLEARKDSPLKK
jgi:cytochrome P450